MEKKKLDIEVFSAWNTYAISMMSVLEHCGMWTTIPCVDDALLTAGSIESYTGL